MSESTLPKPKKSVALSGTAAGNTALCTVGRSGNDLHYRGYDIKDLATRSSFEEVAHLLIHGSLPSADRLRAYRTRLKRLRGLPAIVQEALTIAGIMGYKNDSPFSVGRQLRDILSAPLMIANDRVLANTANLLLMSRLDTALED